MLCYVMLCYVMLCYAMPCLCYVMLCYVMLWYAMLCDVCMYAYMYVCMYVCMYACMYVCIQDLGHYVGPMPKSHPDADSALGCASESGTPAPSPQPHGARPEPEAPYGRLRPPRGPRADAPGKGPNTGATGPRRQVPGRNQRADTMQKSHLPYGISSMAVGDTCGRAPGAPNCQTAQTSKHANAQKSVAKYRVICMYVCMCVCLSVCMYV